MFKFGLKFREIWLVIFENDFHILLNFKN